MNQDKLKQKKREVLIYCRVSSVRQKKEGSGLESQEHRCREHARTQRYKVAQVFKDSFSGGGDFMKRPAMSALLKYADQNLHKNFVVIFDDLSRFARDVNAHFKLRQEFDFRGIEIECPNFTFDNTPAGEMIETMLAAQHQFHRKNNTLQVIQKQQARLEAGYWAFGAKKGYKQVYYEEHGKLSEPKEPEAEFIKEALEGFATGKFPQKIDACRFLVRNNFWKGKNPDKHSDAFSKILNDVFYAGYIEYPKRDIPRRKGKHEGLISLETFEINQKILASKKRNFKKRQVMSPEFPLRGLVCCAECGGHVSASPSRGRNETYAYYFCQGRDKTCPVHRESIPKEMIESDFVNHFKNIQLEDGADVLVKEIFEKVWSSELKKFSEKDVDSKKRVDEIEKEIPLITQKIIKSNSDLVVNEYEKAIETLAREKKELESSLLSNNTDTDIPYRTALDKSLELFKSPYKIWSNADLAEQHRLFFFVFDGKIPYSKKDGYRTASEPYAISLFREFATANPQHVEMVGFEPTCKKEIFKGLHI